MRGKFGESAYITLQREEAPPVPRYGVGEMARWADRRAVPPAERLVIDAVRAGRGFVSYDVTAFAAADDVAAKWGRRTVRVLNVREERLAPLEAQEG